MRTFSLNVSLIALLTVGLFLASCQGLGSTQQPTPVAPTSTVVMLTPAPSATRTPTLTFTPTKTPTRTPTATPLPIIFGPKNFPTNVNPLTGLIVADPKILDRRPVLVKISNFPRNGRPHAGISFADMVFEYYIGEGTNRFMALYYGQDATKIGPVRSGRLVDWQITRQYQGILGFVSADQNTVYPALLNQLGNRAINSAPFTCPAMCDDGTNSVTSVFADSAKLSQLAADKLGVKKIRPNLDGMLFNSTVPDSGLLGKKIGVQFNPTDRGEWLFDPATNKYLRSIENVDNNNKVTMIPLTDRLTGKQLAFSNVILMFAYYTEFAPSLHDISVYNNLNGQRAVLFRDGKAVDAIWKSTGSDNPIQFLTNEGKPIALKSGNTWIVITGINTSLAQPVLGQWEMQFRLP